MMRGLGLAAAVTAVRGTAAGGGCRGGLPGAGAGPGAARRDPRAHPPAARPGCGRSARPPPAHRLPALTHDARATPLRALLRQGPQRTGAADVGAVAPARAVPPPGAAPRPQPGAAAGRYEVCAGSRTRSAQHASVAGHAPHHSPLLPLLTPATPPCCGHIRHEASDCGMFPASQFQDNGYILVIPGDPQLYESGDQSVKMDFLYT